MAQVNKILLVEDDTNLGYLLKEYLELRNFTVVLAQDGVEGLNEFKKQYFHLCLLDVMMPKKDGFTLAEEMRELNPLMPIIFLTSKALKVDKLKGFKLGADDYITKPVDEEELIARILAVLKRSHTSASDLPEFKIGASTFNYNTQTLQIDNNNVQLTTREAELLRMLCQNQGKMVERKKALEIIWGANNYFNRRSMDVFVSKLRKYLSADNSVQIVNIHGKGFMLHDKFTHDNP